MALDIGDLEKFNPWWGKGAVPAGFLGKHQRPALEEAAKRMDKRFMLIIYGLRRVGKTTVLYQLIDLLLKKGVEPCRILYYSFDEQPASIGEVVSLYEEKILKARIGEGKTYLFLDEVQKMDDWQSKLKVLYDLNPSLKIVVSGSASISLQKTATESLAGRVMDIHATPLSFGEFLEWKGIKADERKPEAQQKEMMLQMMDFLRKGGFPEIIGESEDAEIRKYVKNAVLDRVLYKDIQQEFEIRDLELLRELAELFLREPGMIANVDSICKSLRRNRITVTNYIEYLSYALIIRQVKNIRGSALASSRKNKKIYPTSPAFTFALREDFYDDKVLERVAEAAVASSRGFEHYYRNGFEVDFVDKKGKEAIPIEIKFGKPDKSQVIKFMEKFKSKKGIVISKSEFSDKDRIKVIPLWLFLLQKESA